MFFYYSPQKREQKHLEQLKSTLKKNDPVVTAGGIMGTVASVSPERNEVTIKVDDNTRLRVQMRSVLALSKEEGKDAKPEPPPAEIK
jgi:preprotein translocase subunit YajC